MRKTILRLISAYKSQNEDVNSKNWDDIPTPLLLREENSTQNSGDLQFLDTILRKKILGLVVNKVKEEIASQLSEKIPQEEEEEQDQEGLDDNEDGNQ